MNKRKSILIIYDIEDNKKRNKTVKLLESYGIRVQKSAFECYIDDAALPKLKKELKRLIGTEDSIRFYSGCDYCFDIGKNSPIEMYSSNVILL